jgi:hypothetical protein
MIVSIVACMASNEKEPKQNEWLSKFYFLCGYNVKKYI